MSKRFFSIAGILAVVGVLALALAGAGLRASAGAAHKANSWGFDSANLDRTCKPCDDFYQFAMGGWRKTNPIPPEYSSWGTFTELADKNQQNLRQILDDAVKAKAAPGSNEQKIGDFYDLGPRGRMIHVLNGVQAISGHGDISNDFTWWALYNQVRS